MEESRPAISKNCIEGQKQANILYKNHPEFNWIGIASRLWTGDKELKEYKNKYKIEYPLFIDISDQEFIKYKVKKFPSLILLQKGEEAFRTSDFSDSNKISSVIKNFQKKEEL